MRAEIRLEVLDVRGHDWRTGNIEVQVEVPIKGVTGKSRVWKRPARDEVVRLVHSGPKGDIRGARSLVGKRVRIPELEREAMRFADKASRKALSRSRRKGVTGME